MPDFGQTFTVATAGNHTYTGTADYNYIDYRNSPHGVTANFVTGVAQNGWGGTDTFVGFEGFHGSQFDDVIVSNGNNGWGGMTIQGFAGNDRFVGGGSTEDCIQYDQSPSGVFVDLAAGTANDGWGTIDTFVGINSVEGASAFDDVLLGNSNRNSFRGNAGNDRIDGRGGDGDNDQAIYDSSPGGVVVNLALGTALDGFGSTDTLISIENILGSTYNDTIIGNSNNNYLEGGAGNDQIDGGAGLSDSVGFNSASRTVYVNLTSGRAFDGTGGIDTLQNIEGANGTNFDDILIGSNAADVLNGSGGNDLFAETPGNDILLGDSGIDTVSYIGNRSSYFVQHNDGDGTQFITKPDGSRDFLRDIEKLQFSDGIYDIATRTFSSGTVFGFFGASANDTITGNASDNTLAGGGGDDALSGGGGDDLIFGGLGNDTLTGGFGNDLLDGGEGVDTALFQGAIAEYSLQTNSVAVTVGDTVSARDGTDMVTGIERLQFSDRSINLTMSTEVAKVTPVQMNSLIELYVAYFNRVPEASGLSYWIDQLASGTSLTSISSQFYSAGVAFSSVSGYSANMSNSAFTTIVYANVLGRTGSTAPSAADLAYWDSQISTGTTSKQGLIQRMLSDAHTFVGDPIWGWVPKLLDNKVAVGNTHAVQLGVDYNSPTDAINQTVAIAHAVTSTDMTAAINLIGLSNVHLV